MYKILIVKKCFRVTIPFIIPWEQTADLAGQGGMGAFGTHRDPKINIEDGHVKLVQVNILQGFLNYCFRPLVIHR